MPTVPAHSSEDPRLGPRFSSTVLGLQDRSDLCKTLFLTMKKKPDYKSRGEVEKPCNFSSEGPTTLASVYFVFVRLQTKCCFFIPFLRENLYSSSLGGGVATSPMLIVFHGKYSTINPLWHIRHLGKSFQEAGGVNFLPSVHHHTST